ncbi:MAG: MFS transporter [Bdellovibrio sp.]
MKTKVSALSPTVKRLGLISFLADVSSEMLYPITPIFLTTVLGASMTNLGFIEGLAEAIASLLKSYSGIWSDRFGRRTPFIWLGYLFAALSKPLIGISRSWHQVLFARAFDRTGKGLRSAPRDAMLAESVSEELRGAAFGWHRMMDTMGAAVGPLLAILFLSYSVEIRKIYLFAFIPGILSFLVALSLKDKRKESKSKEKTNEKLNPISQAIQIPLRSLPRDFRFYLLSWTIFSLVNSSDVFLLLKTEHEGIDLQQTILLYCFYNLTYALSSPYLGILSDKIGRKKVLVFGLVTFALVYSGFAFASKHFHFWLLFGIYGLYMGATDGVGKAYAIDLLHPEQKATAVGILGTVVGLSTVFASTVAGLLWDHFGPGVTFGYGAFGAIITAVSLVFIKGKK